MVWFGSKAGVDRQQIQSNGKVKIKRDLLVKMKAENTKEKRRRGGEDLDGRGQEADQRAFELNVAQCL